MRILHHIKKINPCLKSLPNGLFAYYKLNDSTNTIVDSISARNLTNTGGDLQQPGILNYSIGFHAHTADYITGTTPLNGQTFQYVTISFWIKMNSIAPTQVITLNTPSNGNGWWIYISSSGYLTIGCTNGSFNMMTQHQTQINTGQWYNVTEILDVSGAKIKYISYINTIALTGGWKESTVDSKSTWNGALWIGRFYSTIWPMNGYIDDFKIWNRALTECEILANYNNGVGVELS